MAASAYLRTGEIANSPTNERARDPSVLSRDFTSGFFSTVSIRALVSNEGFPRVKMARGNWRFYAGSLLSATIISLYRAWRKASRSHTRRLVKRQSIGIIRIALEPALEPARYLLCKCFHLISARVLGRLRPRVLVCLGK